MQQYTADLANSVATAFDEGASTKWDVNVITNNQAPCDRYAPQVKVNRVISIAGTGLQSSNVSLRGFNRVYHAIRASQPDIVHFTGPHIWTPPLLFRLRRVGFPTIHTIHDLDPHSGTGYGRLLYLWNNAVLRWAKHILVHGQIYQRRLLENGLPGQRVTYTPLLHLFLSYTAELALWQAPPHPKSEPFALFFARLEPYKGVDIFIEAMRQLVDTTGFRAIVAGKGELANVVTGHVPNNVEIRNRLLGDAEALDLFQRCSLVVLPYRDATQSAIIAAAYFFGKPVIVTRTGALPEYVIEGETGWVIAPGNSATLAERLRTALAAPERLAEMGTAGRAWYQAQRQIALNTLLAMYRQVNSNS